VVIFNPSLERKIYTLDMNGEQIIQAISAQAIQTVLLQKE
jgi:hypothetical protein